MIDIEIQEVAAALYDGGWRSADIDMMQKEYHLTDHDACKICDELKCFEREEYRDTMVKYDSIQEWDLFSSDAVNTRNAFEQWLYSDNNDPDSVMKFWNMFKGSVDDAVKRYDPEKHLAEVE